MKYINSDLLSRVLRTNLYFGGWTIVSNTVSKYEKVKTL